METPEAAGPDLEPRTLSQLLLLQGTLHVFRDFDRLAGFVQAGLEVLPGVRSVRLVGDGAGKPAPADSSPGAARSLSLPLETAEDSYGRIDLEVDATGVFDRYLPIVQNTANVIAVHLERRAREAVLKRLNKSLQQEIERKNSAERLLGEAQRRLEEIARPPTPASRGGTESPIAVKADSAAARLGAALMVPAAMEEISLLVLQHVERLTESAAGRVAVVELREDKAVEKTLAEDLSTKPGLGSFEEIVGHFGELWRQVLAGQEGGFVNLPPSDSTSPARRAVRRFLAVPVRWGERLLGYIAAIDPPRDYSGEDVALVERLASLYGLAIRRQEELEEQRRQARQAQKSQRLEALGTMASGIAHEFRNLLQIILGSAELILAKLQSEPGSHSELETIREAAIRGASLTEQLLTFARRSEPTLEVLDLNEAVRHVEGMLAHTLSPSIELETRAGDNAGACLGDAGQIEQVLVNLALNARDAMPDGGRLTIETRSGETEATSEIAVSDTGVGIDPTDLAQIFEPFFTTKSLGQGTGLGLAVAYGIVTGHGGRLDVVSRPGIGTTFVISLPRVEDGPVRDAGRKHATPVEAATGETILVVDDEAAIRQLLQRGLGRYGYEVFTAASGEEAIEFCGAGEHPLDLVILDLGMAGMGGRACLAELLRIDPDLKVLVATGYAVDGQKAAQIDGVRGVISKPFPLDGLATKVRATLDGEASG